MHRVVILGLVAALGCVFASQALGQLPPFVPVTPGGDLPGASIYGSRPLGTAPLQPPANVSMAPTYQHPLPAMPPGGSGFVGPSSFNGNGPPMGGVPMPGVPLGGAPLSGVPLNGVPANGPGMAPRPEFPQPGPLGTPPAYVSPHPTPKAPQNLGLYRPSFPEGIEAKKLSPLPSVSVREYPYLRRGQATDKFITPAGMEMPEEVGPTASPTTWRDRLKNLFDPLGVLR
jgi:hypothetical protein